MLGALLAIASAATFGFNTAVVRRSMLRANPYVLIIVSITGATPVFALLAWLTGQWGRAGELGMRGYVLLALAGALNFLGGRYSNFRAIKSMGANLTAPVRTLSVLFGVLLGVFALNEHVGLARGLGIALLVAAPLVAFSQPRAMKREFASGSALKLAEGLLFGLIAAVSYAGATYLLRYVLAGTGLSLLGATVAHAGAGVLLVASLAFRRNRDGLRALDATAWRLFGVITSTMVLAQVFRFSAVETAPITVVSPLIETMGFFGVGFAWMLNRGHESFSPLVLVGIVLAVAGAAAITL
ncbi:MAG: DMT family transporter [Chloroflexota bacterium]